MIKFDIAYLTCIAFSYLQLRKSQGAAVQHISRCADLKFLKGVFVFTWNMFGLFDLKETLH